MNSDYSQRQLRLMLRMIDSYIEGKSNLRHMHGNLMALYLAIGRDVIPSEFRDRFYKAYDFFEEIIARRKDNKFKRIIVKEYIPDLRSLINEYIIKRQS